MDERISQEKEVGDIAKWLSFALLRRKPRFDSSYPHHFGGSDMLDKEVEVVIVDDITVCPRCKQETDKITWMITRCLTCEITLHHINMYERPEPL